MQRIKTDIAIIGGGVSGFAAALGSIEAGNHVVLIERESQLGGNAIQSNVGTICGAYLNANPETPTRIDHPVIHKVLDALEIEPLSYQGLWVGPYEVGKFHQFIQNTLDNMNIDVLLDSSLKTARTEESVIREILIQSGESEITLEAKAFIDSSGNGILSQLAGLEMLQSNSYQAASQVFRVRNIHSDNEYSLNFAIRKVMVESIQQDKVPKELGSLSAVPGSLRGNTIDLKFTVPVKITDSITQNDLDSTGIETTEHVFELLRLKLDSFKEARIEKIFPHAGIRVLQRSKGKYVLTGKDVLEGRKIKGNAVAIGTWPIEEWDNSGRVHLKKLPENDYYEIPSDCLMSYEIGNLFLAGKNISATEEAIGSARVIGTCLQTGYSAGKMASSLISN